MGLAVSVAFDPERYEGKLYMPRRNLKPFPQSRCRAPGQLVTYFRALPPSKSSKSFYSKSPYIVLHKCLLMDVLL